MKRHQSLGRRPEASIDGFPRSKELRDDFSCFVAAKNDAAFANAQTPEACKLTRESTHVPFLPASHINESPANILSYARMQILEGGDDLVREFQAGIALASR